MAVLASGMAWIAGAFSDRIIISIAVLVHLAQPRVLDVEKAMAQFHPDMSRRKPCESPSVGFDGEMFLERDLALHVVSSRLCAASCNVVA